MTDTTSTVRCRMCVRPARYVEKRGQFAIYCSGSACSNRERICQLCGSTFHVNVDGAGTKYCSLACKAKGYRPTQDPAYSASFCCTWCDKPGERGKRRKTETWPYICNQCTEPIKHVVHTLKVHHVPHELARRLITSPGCDICGKNLLAMSWDGGRGKQRAELVVDHDHNCCPVTAKSCGRCIRGLICRHCNSAAGFVHSDPKTAYKLGKYLEKGRLAEW